jgi:hypothetical protein
LHLGHLHARAVTVAGCGSPQAPRLAV